MNAPVPSDIRPLDSQANENPFQVALLDEPLQREKAGMAVVELLAAMRKYHQLRDLSHRERFGTPDRQSWQALSELGDVQRSLQELASGINGTEQDFVVEASLNVRMIPRPAS